MKASTKLLIRSVSKLSSTDKTQRNAKFRCEMANAMRQSKNEKGSAFVRSQLLLAIQATDQQWRVWHSDKIIGFNDMAIDLRRCAGVPIGQAKQALVDSKIGDVFLDCIRIS